MHHLRFDYAYDYYFTFIAFILTLFGILQSQYPKSDGRRFLNSGGIDHLSDILYSPYFALS